MASYQLPIKHNNEFFSIFNSLDYDITSSSKSNPILFNDSRYLKSSGTIVSSSAITNSFNTLAINTLKAKQNIDSFSITTFSSSITLDFTVNMIFYMEISSLITSSLFFINIPTTAQQTRKLLFELENYKLNLSNRKQR